jgi:hypothetical protein
MDTQSVPADNRVPCRGPGSWEKGSASGRWRVPPRSRHGHSERGEVTTQQGVPADWRSKGVRHPGASPVRERETERDQQRSRPLVSADRTPRRSGCLRGPRPSGRRRGGWAHGTGWSPRSSSTGRYGLPHPPGQPAESCPTSKPRSAARPDKGCSSTRTESPLTASPRIRPDKPARHPSEHGLQSAAQPATSVIPSMPGQRQLLLAQDANRC